MIADHFFRIVAFRCACPCLTAFCQFTGGIAGSAVIRIRLRISAGMRTDSLSFFLTLIGAFPVLTSLIHRADSRTRTTAIRIRHDIDAFQIAQNLVLFRAFCRADCADAYLYITALRVAVAAVIAVSQRIVACAVTSQLCAAVDLTAAADAHLAFFAGIAAASAVVAVPI